ncbi:hypothetical protein AGABI1DRAFT_135039 [Agaricus bisporus var. burnettii JB137-S8]|uniref:Uncharacterized protein n=1 Tax=Agaricus bisporus var. burnettii (strain JB137-S8 / ATCC MYA-4627 / FGSC 10392) TaxID=597362 RepID=K5WS14_AGABU|nr:uncharacterized protein AGABI1DRAFT_135039 [Agaricus bisporus var. burnettii JB137-S8]EKM73327.1 hypothetical protein AGABI1DRAFT_135039 [Agaricus bisporus var. burnettii JB137-S8]
MGGHKSQSRETTLTHKSQLSPIYLYTYSQPPFTLAQTGSSSIKAHSIPRHGR